MFFANEILFSLFNNFEKFLPILELCGQRKPLWPWVGAFSSHECAPWITKGIQSFVNAHRWHIIWQKWFCYWHFCNFVIALKINRSLTSLLSDVQCRECCSEKQFFLGSNYLLLRWQIFVKTLTEFLHWKFALMEHFLEGIAQLRYWHIDPNARSNKYKSSLLS